MIISYFVSSDTFSLTQEYAQAVTLLNAADKTIREFSGKIVKIIRWEVLYSNLLSAKLSNGEQPNIVDIDKKVKSCLYALKVDSGIYRYRVQHVIY